jgi:two-component system sensor kinase FixL
MTDAEMLDQTEQAVSAIERHDSSSELYRMVFNHASDAILLVDLESETITAANPRLEELTGFTTAQLERQPATCLFPRGEGGSEDVRAFNRQVLGRVGLHEDVRLRRADDHAIYVSIAVGHIDSEKGRTAVLVLRDTTERRLLERELITKHMALRQAHLELQHATTSLEQRNTELVRLSNRVATLAKQAAIGAFTAGVAHSINNPLAALISAQRRMREHLEEDRVAVSGERLRTLHDRQCRAALRIQNVVQDIRRVHRGGAPRGQPAVVDLCKEIDAVLTMMCDRLEGVAVKRQLEPGTSLTAYPDELSHLLENLFENAAQALDGHGTLQVTARSFGNTVKVTVEDDGPGVSSVVADRLFEPFVSGKQTGTGLGLWLSQRIAQHHRGSLRCEAVEPHGTRFVLEMPRTQLHDLTQRRDVDWPETEGHP